MVFPLGDDNPLERIRFQAVTVLLIGLCAAVFLYQMSLSPEDAETFIISYGLIPALLNGDAADMPVPPELTILTSMFLHGGFMHLLGNMVYLWVFGDNIEDAMGHGRFAVFYVLAGIAAALAQVAADPLAYTPMVGASGAISGVLGAYLVLHPRTKVLVFLFRFSTRLPAAAVLGLWIGTQLVSAAVEDGTGGVAWWAHIGGFVAGMVLVVPFRAKGVPLFDRDAVPGAVIAVPGQRGAASRRGRSRIPDSGHP